MSKMGLRTAGRRARRQFSEEFRIGAVRLILDEGKTVGAVARDLDLTASALAHWVKRGRADRTKGKTGLTTALLHEYPVGVGRRGPHFSGPPQEPHYRDEVEGPSHV